MKGISKAEYFISKKAGAAINRYGMISAGDRVMVGVSGGKDSLTLLRILHQRKKWLPVDYKLKAVHVITDYDARPAVRRSKLESYFRSLGCEYIFREIEISKDNRLDREDCFWCSWNRRKAIFEAAGAEGYNKVALGHHKDDIAETILMNMFFNGEVSSINPVQELFEGKIVIVRPLVLLEEREIERYAKAAGIPVIKSSCPRSRSSKRAEVKELLTRLSKMNREVKSNIVKAPGRIRKDYIPESIF